MAPELAKRNPKIGVSPRLTDRVLPKPPGVCVGRLFLRGVHYAIMLRIKAEVTRHLSDRAMLIEMIIDVALLDQGDIRAAAFPQIPRKLFNKRRVGHRRHILLVVAKHKRRFDDHAHIGNSLAERRSPSFRLARNPDSSRSFINKGRLSSDDSPFIAQTRPPFPSGFSRAIPARSRRGRKTSPTSRILAASVSAVSSGTNWPSSFSASAKISKTRR